MFVVCCVVMNLCDGLPTRSEEFQQLCVCVCVCELETSTVRRSRPELGCCATEESVLCNVKCVGYQVQMVSGTYFDTNMSKRVKNG
jgi:hypothetical protein